MVLFNLPLGDEPDYGYRVAQATDILGSSYYRLDAASNACSYSVGVFDFSFQMFQLIACLPLTISL